MEIAITALGTANPSHKSTQQHLAELVSQGFHLNPAEKRLLKSIYKTTGIETRYSVLTDSCKSPGKFEFFPNDPTLPFPSTAIRMKIYKDNALNLAIAAIENCLDTLPHFNLSEITHLITVSCTGMYAPGIDIEIVQTLKLNPSTKRTAIQFMGCYGAFNAIKIAESICKAEPHANVLLVCVELCTIHFQKKMDLDNMISNAIFADGAAAAIIQKKTIQQKSLSLDAFYCELIPQTNQEMAWHIADNGFDIVLSTYVPEVIKLGIANFTQKLLDKHKLNLSDIDIYAIHPGGLKILQACETALSITEKDNKYAYRILKQFGNMSSATILFVLKAIWDDIALQDNQKKIFSCAFGPGLTLESMLLKVDCNT